MIKNIKEDTTVEDYFEIDEDHLFTQSEKGGYWFDSYEFFQNVRSRKVVDLTKKQFKWLENIEKKLELFDEGWFEAR